jgi:signal transduction histidine kinase/ligand-binding sensor domain-containing protein
MIGKARQHNTLFCIFSAGLLLLGVHPEVRPQATKYSFDRVGLEQGLPSLSVFAIAQDRRGFLWFGTTQGLCRYDGYNVKIFDRTPFYLRAVILDDHQGSLWYTPMGELHRLGMTSGRVRQYKVGNRPRCLGLYLDTSGDIWAGTFGGGLVRYDRSNDSTVIYSHQPGKAESLCNDTVWSVYEDSKKDLWVGTSRGLERFNRKTESFSHIDSLRSNPSTWIQEDVEGSDRALWIATDNGLCRFDPSTGAFSRTSVLLGQKSAGVVWVHQDRHGNVWVVGDGDYIGWLDKRTHRIELLRDPNTGRQLAPSWQGGGILEDRKGTLWFAIDRGVAVVDGPSKRCEVIVANPADSHGLPGPPFYLLEDDACNIWIATLNSGACMLDRNRMQFQRTEKLGSGGAKLASAPVTSILEDSSGILWVGSPWEFRRLDLATGSAKRYNLRGVSALALLEVRAGTLWLGAYDGLYQLETATGKLTRLPPLSQPSHGRPVSDSYNELMKDRSGRIWTGGGIANGLLGVVDPSTGASERYFVDDDSAAFGMPSAPIAAIHEDRYGTLWFTKSKIGIFDRQSKQARFFQIHPDTAGRSRKDGCGAICESRDGTLWFVVGAGLAQFNRRDSTFILVGVKEGLPETPILGLLEDDSGGREGAGQAGKLWLLTLRGLTRYDPSTGAVSHYGPADGVDIAPSDFCHSSFKSRKGYLYFGGTNGFIRFHPDSVRENTVIPPVIITSFKIFNAEADLDSAIGEKKSVELSYRENIFAIEFAALNYVRSEKNQYAYRLEGFDKDWVYCGTRRTTTYTNLDPGSYVFRVKGSNNDGKWNEAGAFLQITIVPPYWQRLWFRLLAGAALALAVVIAYRRKVAQLNKEKFIQQEFSRQQIVSADMARKKLAAELHDGLAQDLLVASNELQRFLVDGNGTKAEVAQAAGLVRESIQAVREISSDLHPHHLDRLGFISAVEAMTQNLARTTSLSIRSSLDNVDGLLGKETEIHLYRIIQEALTNVVRHASAQNVCVAVLKKISSVEIIVTDDGKGFTPGREQEPTVATTADPLHGFGLASMKERAKIVGASIQFESSPGKGTSVHVTFPQIS